MTIHNLIVQSYDPKKTISTQKATCTVCMTQGERVSEMWQIWEDERVSTSWTLGEAISVRQITTAALWTASIRTPHASHYSWAAHRLSSPSPPPPHHLPLRLVLAETLKRSLQSLLREIQSWSDDILAEYLSSEPNMS